MNTCCPPDTSPLSTCAGARCALPPPYDALQYKDVLYPAVPHPAPLGTIDIPHHAVPPPAPPIHPIPSICRPTVPLPPSPCSFVRDAQAQTAAFLADVAAGRLPPGARPLVVQFVGDNDIQVWGPCICFVCGKDSGVHVYQLRVCVGGTTICRFVEAHGRMRLNTLQWQASAVLACYRYGQAGAGLLVDGRMSSEHLPGPHVPVPESRPQ